MESEFSTQKFQEIVLQFLFALDMGGEGQEELIPVLMKELAVSKKNVRAAYARALTIWEERSFLDKIIEEKSENYALDRIKNIEKNILRMGVFELLIEKKLNARILISEAIRLTRKFSTPEGASFVNALLDCLETKGDSIPALQGEASL